MTKKKQAKSGKRGKIAFQGEPGANSHIACKQAYPEYAPLACATFEDAFAAVRNGRAALAMIPIDNSVAGRVADIHHLMPASQLHIVAEWFLPVQHQLVAPHGATLRTIRTVESHIHALGQCRNVIRKLGVKPVVAADTALADACATALGNRVSEASAINSALEWIGTIPGLEGAVVVVGEHLGAWGQIELVPL